MLIDLAGVVAQTNATLPAGTYSAVVETAELKNTKSNDGKFLEVWFKILSGDHKNRKVSKKFNVENKSEKAKEIGRGELKSLLLCAGLDGKGLNSTAEIIGRQVGIKTKIDVWEDKERAEIKSFLTFDQAPLESTPKKAF